MFYHKTVPGGRCGALGTISLLREAPKLSTRDLRHEATMHYDAHQPIINDLEARITTIRDSL